MSRAIPDNSAVAKYLPEFWTRFWLSSADGPLLSSRPTRLYRYQVYDNELTEITHRDLIPSQSSPTTQLEPESSSSLPNDDTTFAPSDVPHRATTSASEKHAAFSSSSASPSPLPHHPHLPASAVFHDLDFPSLLDPETRKELDAATEAFATLERDVEVILTDLLQRTAWSNGHRYGSLQSSGRPVNARSFSPGSGNGEGGHFDTHGTGFGAGFGFGSTSTSQTSIPLGSSAPSKTSLPFDQQSIENVKKYLLFLRFRNSAGYAQIVESLEVDEPSRGRSGSESSGRSSSLWSSSSRSSMSSTSSTSTAYSSSSAICSSPTLSHAPMPFPQPQEDTKPNLQIYPAYRPYILLIRLRVIFRKFTEFLKHTPAEREIRLGHQVFGFGLDGRWREAPADYHCLSRGADWKTGNSGNGMASIQELLSTYCWNLCEADMCVGIAADDQEFMFSDRGFGTLDEGFDEDPNCENLCFPIFPTVSIYLISELGPSHSPPSSTNTTTTTQWIDVSPESAIDVHLRNAMLLQTYPPYLFFRSLRSVALSISSYNEFRWIQEHQDYSRLKQRCRQKFLQETVTKTLVVRDELTVTDLSDEIVVLGDSPVGHGAFSDVWKGMWCDPNERRHKAVALKFLRQVVVQNVREKLLRRLQTEIVAWHRVSHRNVIQFFGIVQAPMGIAMVSPWCENGTVTNFLKHNPEANRLKLLSEAAAGVAYLHATKPMIVHGDLRAGNILVDKHGQAIINDFGLSKVIEDLTEGVNGMASSFFSGSTRWMAPELIMALVDDQDTTPPITPQSDVYSFGCVCLEFATDTIPYPNRTNNHAVTLDIIRGVKPRRGQDCLLKLSEDSQEVFWRLVEQCWESEPSDRPSMPDILDALACIRLGPSRS